MRIFGNKRQRQEYIGEFRNLWSSSGVCRVIKSRMMRQSGYVAHMHRNEYKILVEKPEITVRLRRPGDRWEDNI